MNYSYGRAALGLDGRSARAIRMHSHIRNRHVDGLSPSCGSGAQAGGAQGSVARFPSSGCASLSPSWRDPGCGARVHQP